MKKTGILIIILSSFVLAACDYEESGISDLNEVTDTTVSIKEGSTETVKVINVDGRKK